MNTGGLSLDQAPPIRVPFAFFLAAPLFAILAGGFLLWQGNLALLTRWSPAALAVTHLIALGFLTQVMCGALFQMLPVLAGARVAAVTRVAPLVQGCLVTGTLSLSGGLYWGGALWLVVGAVLLSCALLIFIGAAGLALARARGVPRTLQAMRLALLALLMTLLLGGLLVAVLLGAPIGGFTHWVDLHLGWGLLGWVGMLVMGVGYQVVPMFHVTPAYPPWLTRAAAPLVFAGLLVATGLTLTGSAVPAAWGFGVSVSGLVLFAVVTLILQRRRERPRLDVTLIYWWTAMLAALAAALVWALDGRVEPIGVLLLIGVGIGLPSGMLLKIMPFLSWFHLQHRQVTTRRFDVRLPYMQVFIPERLARIQFGVFLGALLVTVAAAGWPVSGWGAWLARLGGLGLVVSSVLLWWLQAGCVWRYREISRRLG
nr:hypothetical protein [Thiocystis violacea]